MEEFSEEEKEFYKLISPFNYRDLQTCINIKRHLKVNGKKIEQLEEFLNNFIIARNSLRRKKKRLTEEQRQLRKERLQKESYGRVEYKP